MIYGMRDMNMLRRRRTAFKRNSLWLAWLTLCTVTGFVIGAYHTPEVSKPVEYAGNCRGYSK